MMKKLLGILVLGLLISENSNAEEKVLTIEEEKVLIIKCKPDDPEIDFLRPIYVIDLENRKAEAGMQKYQVLEIKPHRIILGYSSKGVEIRTEFDRMTGKYTEVRKFFGETAKKYPIVRESGICVKKEKIF